MLNYIIRYSKIFAVIALIFISIYFFVRTYFFLSSDYRGINLVFSIILLLAETQMIIHALGFMIDILRLNHKKTYFQKYKNLENRPSVAIIVAAKNEPAEVLEKTFVTLDTVEYPQKNIYFLEDSDDPRCIKRDKKLTEKYGISFFQPKKLHGAKAGIINDFLKVCQEKYIAVFDADQNPMPDFLKKVVPIIEASEKIAFVQTPQFYSNVEYSPIAKAAEMQQAVFYESICEAKGSVNAMFCCGSNVILRVSALQDVGGFDEESITEDFATSIKFHLKGYHSVYYNHVCVFGLAPKSLQAYLKQQARWAGGTLGVFRIVLKKFLANPFALKLSQWWEYYLSGTYYLVGWVFFILMICPIVYILFGVPSYFTYPQAYLITFIPYYIATLLLFYATMKKRHYQITDVFHGIIMGSLSFPVLMTSTLLGFLGKKMRFEVTKKGASEVMPLLSLWPWFSIGGLNILAIGIGFAKLSTNPYALGVNIFWCTYHLFILMHIVYFNQRVIDKKDNLKKLYVAKTDK